MARSHLLSSNTCDKYTTPPDNDQSVQEQHCQQGHWETGKLGVEGKCHAYGARSLSTPPLALKLSSNTQFTHLPRTHIFQPVTPKIKHKLIKYRFCYRFCQDVCNRICHWTICNTDLTIIKCRSNKMIPTMMSKVFAPLTTNGVLG